MVIEKTFYYSRWKEAHWRRSDDPLNDQPYENFFHQIKISVDVSDCKLNTEQDEKGEREVCDGGARISLEFFSQVGKVGILSPGIMDSGIWHNKKFYRVEPLVHPAHADDGFSTGDLFVVRVPHFMSTPCNGFTNTNRFAYTRLNLDSDEEPKPDYHHYLATVSVKVAECGKGAEVDFSLRMVDPQQTAAQGKHVTELTGPDDPKRAPRQ